METIEENSDLIENSDFDDYRGLVRFFFLAIGFGFGRRTNQPAYTHSVLSLYSSYRVRFDSSVFSVYSFTVRLQHCSASSNNCRRLEYFSLLLCAMY